MNKEEIELLALELIKQASDSNIIVSIRETKTIKQRVVEGINDDGSPKFCWIGGDSQYHINCTKI